MLGRTVDLNGNPMIVELYDDPRKAPDSKKNTPFRKWDEVLSHWETRGNIEFRRIAHGMDSDALFGFLGDGIKVEIQGPFSQPVTDPVDGTVKQALPFLHKPADSALMHLQDETGAPSASFSSSHTINGHSVALRFIYGNVRFNLTGDLNQESMALMRARLDLSELESEVLKAPHHGSADFDFEALRAMKPVVSLISSGDESANKEHIHPRATSSRRSGK